MPEGLYVLNPLNVNREDFPISSRNSGGMVLLSPKLDNYDIEHIGDMSDSSGGRKFWSEEILSIVNKFLSH